MFEIAKTLTVFHSSKHFTYHYKDVKLHINKFVLVKLYARAIITK